MTRIRASSDSNAQIAELTRCMESNHRVIGEQANKIAAGRERESRMRLALGLLLKDRGGLDSVLDVLENDIAEIQAIGGDVTALNALVAALVDVQRHNDLRREEVSDGDDAR